jgi:hypothetical protein
MTTTRSDDVPPVVALELTLREMLDDPIVRALMERDGVREDELAALMERINRRPLGEHWPHAA